MCAVQNTTHKFFKPALRNLIHAHVCIDNHTVVKTEINHVESVRFIVNTLVELVCTLCFLCGSRTHLGVRYNTRPEVDQWYTSRCY